VCSQHVFLVEAAERWVVWVYINCIILKALCIIYFVRVLTLGSAYLNIFTDFTFLILSVLKVLSIIISLIFQKKYQYIFI
jgi:hypothetical protein